MKLVIIYSSNTGNTEKIANTIKATLENKGEIIYFGGPTENVPQADVYFIGSWTDKGGATNQIKNTLSKMKNCKIAYFGTAGFKEDEAYYKKIFENISEDIDATNNILGYFFCQGKMPLGIKARYLKLLEKDKENTEILGQIENFDNALNHPNSDDCEKVKKWALEIFEKVES